MGTEYDPRKPIFENYENLIRNKAHQMARATAVPLEELLGQGALTFVEAKAEYNPDKCYFSTWLSIRLQQDFIKFCRRWMKNSSASEEQVVDVGIGMFCAHFQSPEKIFLFREALQSMTSLSKSIVRALLDDPGKIFGDLDNCSIGDARNKIRKHFRDNGFTIRDIQASFKEIKAIL